MSLGLLLSKYNVALPRYTSYPTVPHWQSDSLDEQGWKASVQRTYSEHGHKGISLYVHLTYCESLCTYCGCNKRITKNHGVEQPYIHSVLKEWKMYVEMMGERPRLAELHLGGGTPTFFSAANLDLLLSHLAHASQRDELSEFSVEVHPSVTSEGQLRVLYEHGFRRISVGVQDFDLKVQKMIHRIQTPKQTSQVIELARNIGFKSVNVDVIYGLPGQTLDSVEMTFDHVAQFKPERIAFYSYAHVPWKSPGQRGYSERDLPDGREKLVLFQYGKDRLMKMGYEDIGMDHFALPNDELSRSFRDGTLHRNFMGYTPTKTNVLIGLGASSISDTGEAYMQNLKVVEEYALALNENQLPMMKGHKLTPTEKDTKEKILDIMCKGYVYYEGLMDETNPIRQALQPLQEDGLISIKGPELKVKQKGKSFLRNVAACFDPYLLEKQYDRVFSKAI